jgi:adenylosuccinate lyase
MANFAFRFSYQAQCLSEVHIFGKFAGAVGNYNAHKIAYQELDWPRIANEFVTSLGLQFNPYVTQANFILLYLYYCYKTFTSTFALTIRSRV